MSAEEHYREALERIAAEAYVPIGNWPIGWRAVAVERIDIAREALAQWDGNPKGGDGTAPSRSDDSPVAKRCALTLSRGVSK